MIRRPLPRSSRSASARPRSRGGFTLVELLVATAITLVVLGLMVQVTFSTLQTFDRVTGTLNSKTEAHRIFEYLRRDFASLVWRRDDNVWLLATVQPDQTANSGKGDTAIADALWIPSGSDKNPKPGNANPSTAASSLRLQKDAAPANAAARWQDLADYRFGQAGVWLRFFTRQTTSLTPTTPEPIAVAYQIVRMPPQANSTAREYRYLLFRSAVRPASTQAAPRSVATAGYDLTDKNTANSYNKPTTTNSGNLEPGGIRTPDRELILANNVVDFGIRFWRRDATTGRAHLLFPAIDDDGLPDNTALGYAATLRTPQKLTTTDSTATPPTRGSVTVLPFGSNLTEAGFNTAGEENVGYPDYAEVMVRLLTDEGARLLAAYENGDTTAPSSGTAAPTATERDAYWWTIVEQHSVVYVDTIPLPSRPL